MSTDLFLDGLYIKVETYETQSASTLVTVAVVTNRQTGASIMFDLKRVAEGEPDPEEDYTDNTAVLYEFKKTTTYSDALSILSRWGIIVRQPKKLVELFKNSSILVGSYITSVNESNFITYIACSRVAPLRKITFDRPVSNETTTPILSVLTVQSTIDDIEALCKSESLRYMLSYGFRYGRDMTGLGLKI